MDSHESPSPVADKPEDAFELLATGVSANSIQDRLECISMSELGLAIYEIASDLHSKWTTG